MAASIRNAAKAADSIQRTREQMKYGEKRNENRSRQAPKGCYLKKFEGNLAIHNGLLCLFLQNTVLFNEIKTPKPLKLQGFGGKMGIPPA